MDLVSNTLLAQPQGRLRPLAMLACTRPGNLSMLVGSIWFVSTVGLLLMTHIWGTYFQELSFVVDALPTISIKYQVRVLGCYGVLMD